MAARIPVKSLVLSALGKKTFLLKMQQLILGTGIAIWWVTELDFCRIQVFFTQCHGNKQ
jgi:hypothetical protein